MSYKSLKEGSLDAPTRLPIEWESEAALFVEVALVGRAGGRQL